MNRDALEELAPLLRRVAGLDPAATTRVRCTVGTATAYLRLPFGVLVSRTVPVPVTNAGDPSPDSDEAFRAADLLAWLDGDRTGSRPPEPDNLLWRGALPPPSGWHRLEQVPDEDIRAVVRAAALALKEQGPDAGQPGVRRSRGAADSLLDAVGLTVSDGDRSVEIPVRALSALTRMGFLARDSHAFVDVARGWTRVVGRHGNVYVDRAPLTVTSR